MSPFSPEVRRRIKDKQENQCAMCGRVTFLEVHHEVPENALKPLGIRGKCNEENGVGLCNPNGKGCHEIANRKAINEHLFFKDGKFVPLEEIDPIQYTKENNSHLHIQDDTSVYKFKDKKQRKKEHYHKERNNKRSHLVENYYVDPMDINADINFRKRK